MKRLYERVERIAQVAAVIAIFFSAWATRTKIVDYLPDDSPLLLAQERRAARLGRG